ncbi:MAG: ABC transporter permease [Eubacterium sp.]|nr:ABC transporter permease [Eubacterium sp.]
MPAAVLAHRKLVGNLAKNDFKTKFAGSYLGIIWAFVQPIVTVFVYWFVFEKALNVGSQSTKAGIEVPYVLWLVAGLVPWFYFSDTLNAGTSVLLEYSYLVKKVVFRINTLPVVKVISGLFVHLFFLGFTLVLYALYGRFPDLYMLQIFYYSFCMIILVTGLSYATSAMVVFFRDLSQMISIFLQILVWATPIMWNIDAVGFGPKVKFILKLNPMFYVINGYRGALINKEWFFSDLKGTLYFWMITLLLYGFGANIFHKLKTHFADVL